MPQSLARLLPLLGGTVLCLALGYPLPEPALAKAPAASSRSYLLNQEQLARLRALGIRIMLPAHVPQGYAITDVRAENVKGTRPGAGPSYTITYSNAAGQSFAMDAASSGIGDAPADKIEFVRHPLWGQIHVLTAGHPGQVKAYFCDWIGKGPYYHVYSPARISSDPEAKQFPISKAEFFEVVKSLAYL